MSIGRSLARTWLLSLALFAALAGSALAQSTLNVSLDQDPYIIDPTANWLYDVPANMFVTLVTYDFETSSVSPAGAESWEVS